MKLGQLLVNGGTWNGHRILTQEWSRRATSPLYEVKDFKPLAPSSFLKYGYLWWVLDYPYKGRTVQAFYAGGNGGQVVMGIPELDLVIMLYGGNYADGRVSTEIQQSYVGKYILPAVDEKR
jgi:CubicO group peptidase (beta-lactamase class C family)